MRLWKKTEKAVFYALRNIIYPVSPATCTRFIVSYYRRRGMVIKGQPNYVSRYIEFDGTDYSQIELNEGCTISSYVRILTHDWSPYTIGRGVGLKIQTPIGVFRPVRVGRFAFVGTCSVLLPGADIGDGAVVGAGSAVRGKVPPWTIVAGSPAEPVGDSREYLLKILKRQGRNDLLIEAEDLLAKQGFTMSSQSESAR